MWKCHEYLESSDPRTCQGRSQRGPILAAHPALSQKHPTPPHLFDSGKRLYSGEHDAILVIEKSYILICEGLPDQLLD